MVAIFVYFSRPIQLHELFITNRPEKLYQKKLNFSSVAKNYSNMRKTIHTRICTLSVLTY